MDTYTALEKIIQQYEDEDILEVTVVVKQENSALLAKVEKTSKHSWSR